MLHIKLKGTERRAPRIHILYPYTHPLRWVRMVKPFFSECGLVAYQIKGKEVKTSMGAKT